MTNIHKRCQHVEMTVDSEDWILDWLDPLRRALQVALSTKSLVGNRDLLECLLDQA